MVIAKGYRWRSWGRREATIFSSLQIVGCELAALQIQHWLAICYEKQRLLQLGRVIDASFLGLTDALAEEDVFHWQLQENLLKQLDGIEDGIGGGVVVLRAIRRRIGSRSGGGILSETLAVCPLGCSARQMMAPSWMFRCGSGVFAGGEVEMEWSEKFRGRE